MLFRSLWRSAFKRSIGKAYSTVQYSIRNTAERSIIINNAKHATQQLSFRLSHQTPAAIVQPPLSKELNKLSMTLLHSSRYLLRLSCLRSLHMAVSSKQSKDKSKVSALHGNETMLNPPTPQPSNPLSQVEVPLPRHCSYSAHIQLPLYQPHVVDLPLHL